MEVSIEKQEGIARKVTISVAAKVFDKAVNKKLARYAKNAKLPGFRKGKIPQKMLEKQFGGSALKEAMDELINEYYPKALQQEKIMPASLLNIVPTQMERGKDFVFDVDIEVYPEIDPPTLEGETIEAIEVDVTEADIDRTIDSIQKRQTEYTETDKAAKQGDKLTVDFTGTIKGEAFAGGEGKDAELVLGEGRFMPEFEKNLEGAKKGDEKTFKLKFPKDYHGKDVAGKTAEFAVIVKKIEKGTLPKIDDTFAKSMGIEGGIKAMREEVREGLDRELKQKQRNALRDQVLSKIADKYDFPIPKAPVEEEINRAVAEVTRQLEQQGIPSKDMIKRENYQEPSEKRVKLGLLVNAVVEEEKLKPDEKLIEKRVDELAGSYAEPDKYKQYVMNDEQQRNQIASVVIEEQVIDHLISTAKLKNVKKSYEEFMTSE